MSVSTASPSGRRRARLRDRLSRRRPAGRGAPGRRLRPGRRRRACRSSSTAATGCRCRSRWCRLPGPRQVGHVVPVGPRHVLVDGGGRAVVLADLAGHHRFDGGHWGDALVPAGHRGAGRPVVGVEAGHQLVRRAGRRVGQPLAAAAVAALVVEAAGTAGPVEPADQHRLGGAGRAHGVEQLLHAGTLIGDGGTAQGGGVAAAAGRRGAGFEGGGTAVAPARPVAACRLAEAQVRLVNRSNITDGSDRKAAATWLQKETEWSASAMFHWPTAWIDPGADKCRSKIATRPAWLRVATHCSMAWR